MAKKSIKIVQPGRSDQKLYPGEFVTFECPFESEHNRFTIKGTYKLKALWDGEKLIIDDP